MTDIDPDIYSTFLKNEHSIKYDINTFKSLITTNIFSLYYMLKSEAYQRISETWLSTISPINMLNIPNNSLIHSERESKRGGVWVVFIFIICIKYLSIFIEESLEYIFFNWEMQYKNKQ